jgi:DNA-directed RNA polymerase subunit RPC12/RpoP
MMQMVMDASGKGMVCRPCAGLAPKEQKTSTIRQQFARPKSAKESSGKYACANCKYRFSSSKPGSTISCPYCGSRRLSTAAQNSADALLRDASGKEYDF